MKKSDRKRIVYFIQLPPPVHGVSTMNHQIYNSEFINRYLEKRLIRIRFSNQISELRRFQLKKLWIFITTWFRLLFTLISFRPQTVYFSLMPVGKGFTRDIFYAFLMKVFVHDVVFHLHNRGISKHSRKTFMHLIYRKVFSNSIIIHVSEGLLKSEIIPLNVKNSSLHFINNTVDPIRDTHKTISSQDLNILFFSNLLPEKGLMNLLLAFVALQPEFPNIRLHVCGASFDSKEDLKIKSFIDQHDLGHKVCMAGPCYGERKYTIFSESDIFVFPSYFEEECMPLVILEAMSAQLPIVATRIGAIPEMISDGTDGFLVSPRDQDQLQERIETLILNPGLREKMGHEAYKKFITHYEPSIFEKKMRSVLVPE